MKTYLLKKLESYIFALFFSLSKRLKCSKLLLKFSNSTRFFMTIHKYAWLSEMIRLKFLTGCCESGRSRQASWESMSYLGSYSVSDVCAPNVKPPHCYHRISIFHEAVCFIRNYLMSHFCNWGIFFRNLLTTGIPATGGISINRGWLTRPVCQQHFNEHKLARLYLSCVLSVFPTSHFALCSHKPL